MDLEKLSVLKEKLISAKDFKDPWNYFFDYFGEDPAFLQLGHQSRDPNLKIIFEGIGKQLFQKKVKVTNLLLTEIAEYSFFHGACFIQGRIATILFFKDIDKGLLAISMSRGSSAVSLVRFSSLKIESGSASTGKSNGKL